MQNLYRQPNEEPDIDKCKTCANLFPCGICNKNVNKNHRAFKCDNKTCNQWVHIKCNILSKKDSKISKIAMTFFSALSA